MQQSPRMSPLLEQVVETHRAEQQKRERAWADELEVRRAEIAKHAHIDVDALRVKLAI
jgi:putative heme degradation protein